MSKVCIGVLTNTTITKDMLHRQLAPQLDMFGLGCFFELSYAEPFLKAFANENCILFSISDSWEFDNCEMFLLPDDCSINGRRNVVPFKDRMCQLKEVLRSILTIAPRIDLFLGDSGTAYEEFELYRIGMPDFLKVAYQFNQLFSCDMHMIISRTQDEETVLLSPPEDKESL